MITSATELANMALVAHLGNSALSDWATDTTKAGKTFRIIYPTARDALLRAHQWNFAIRRAALAADATAPNHEFDYAYPLPTSPYCLRVIRTNWEADGYASTAVYGFPGLMGGTVSPVEWRIENHNGVRSLLTNEASISIEYIARIEDVSVWSDDFVETLALRIAAQLAMPVADNQALARSLAEMAEAKLRDARSHDAFEGTPREIVDTDGWLRARL